MICDNAFLLFVSICFNVIHVTEGKNEASCHMVGSGFIFQHLAMHNLSKRREMKHVGDFLKHHR